MKKPLFWAAAAALALAFGVWLVAEARHGRPELPAVHVAPSKALPSPVAPQPVKLETLPKPEGLSAQAPGPTASPQEVRQPIPPPIVEVDPYAEALAQIQKEAELDILAKSKGWDKTYSKLPRKDLETAANDIDLEIVRSTDATFESMFKDGNVSVTANMPAYDIGGIYRVRFDPNVGTYSKATLSKNDFPELYEKKDLFRWLQAQIRKQSN